VLIFFSGDIPVIHDCDDRGELCAPNGWVLSLCQLLTYRYYLSDSSCGHKIETCDTSSCVHIDGDEKVFSVGSSLTIGSSGVFPLLFGLAAL